MSSDLFTFENPKRIRSVERTIDIIEFLAVNGASTLNELRKETGLSNSTLLRCLATLNDKGWVRRYLAEGRYELTNKFSSKLLKSKKSQPIPEIAAPHMQNLLKKTGWPSDFAIRGKTGTLTIIETSRTKGPLSPNQTVYGLSPSLVYSALGRAFLSGCSKEERDKLLLALKIFGKDSENKIVNSEIIEKITSEIKLKGYAVGEKGYWFEPVKQDPNLFSIAVPIGQGSKLIGAISIIMDDESVDFDHISKSLVPSLRETSEKIFMDISNTPA